MIWIYWNEKSFCLHIYSLWFYVHCQLLDSRKLLKKAIFRVQQSCWEMKTRRWKKKPLGTFVSDTHATELWKVELWPWWIQSPANGPGIAIRHLFHFKWPLVNPLLHEPFIYALTGLYTRAYKSYGARKFHLANGNRLKSMGPVYISYAVLPRYT